MGLTTGATGPMTNSPASSAKQTSKSRDSFPGIGNRKDQFHSVVRARVWPRAAVTPHGYVGVIELEQCLGGT